MAQNRRSHSNFLGCLSCGCRSPIMTLLLSAVAFLAYYNLIVPLMPYHVSSSSGWDIVSRWAARLVGGSLTRGTTRLRSTDTLIYPGFAIRFVTETRDPVTYHSRWSAMATRKSLRRIQCTSHDGDLQLPYHVGHGWLGRIMLLQNASPRP